MIRFLLLHRIEWTDRHQGATLAAFLAYVILASIFKALVLP